jgi:hypothetical protein
LYPSFNPDPASGEFAVLPFSTYLSSRLKEINMYSADKREGRRKGRKERGWEPPREERRKKPPIYTD